ncbi:TlpA family protein disulfide reductase [Rhodohalobacter sp. 8-1]|uniref:TlpA family protein disulfide reductase n=1 Tax=Rhodohalobacter sp. 8-1 TaxID=3131972 RepID=UPI0030ECA751
MRLDQKYFIPFLLICAALTAIVIFLSSLNYASNQRETFREEIEEASISEWKLYHYASGDSLSFSQFKGSTVIVHFWSTWSDLSLELNSVMSQLQSEFSGIVIVAAAARDAENLVEEHIQTTDFDFVYVDGTPLYQELMVPGLPSQLFINRQGTIVDQNVGKDVEAIRQKARELVNR